jgi:hypothetical protein
MAAILLGLAIKTGFWVPAVITTVTREVQC